MRICRSRPAFANAVVNRRGSWRSTSCATPPILIVQHMPPRFTTAFAKAGRERQILIDYLRNNRTNTSIAAFSTLARPHAPVSIPLRWAELSARLKPDRQTIRTVPARFARLSDDPWKDYWQANQRLTASALRAVGST